MRTRDYWLFVGLSYACAALAIAGGALVSP